MGMKKNQQTINRMKEMKIRAEQIRQDQTRKIIHSMSSDDLLELADDNTTEKRFNEIWERAVHEYKQKHIKEN